MPFDYSEAQEFLMRELRLMTAPVAIKYFFDEQELAAFRSRASHYVPIKPITFCQAEIGARMEDLAVLVEANKLGCSNARFVFGWKEFDEAEVKSHIKYCQDMDQADRFVQGKPRLHIGIRQAHIRRQQPARIAHPHFLIGEGERVDS